MIFAYSLVSALMHQSVLQIKGDCSKALQIAISDIRCLIWMTRMGISG